MIWITLLYLAGAASFVLLQYASLRLPAAKVMAYTHLTPAWVVLWEMALGHPTPPLLTLAGLALIVTAFWLLQEDTPEPTPIGTPPTR